MTVGTAIFASVCALCVTFIVIIGIGAALANKKSKAAEALTSTLTEEINNRLKKSLNKAR